MKRSLLLFTLVFSTSSLALAQTCTTQWTGAVSSNFADSLNWSNSVPLVGDVGCINGADTTFVDHPPAGGIDYGTIILGGETGMHTLTINAPVTFEAMIVEATGIFDLADGSLEGTVENRGTIRIAPPNGVVIDAGPPISNFGRLEIMTGFAQFYLKRTLINEVGGTIAMIGGFSPDAAGRAMISSDNEYQIINRGLITSTGGGTGTSEHNQIGHIEGGPLGYINEGGRVEVWDGRLQIACPGACRYENGEYYAAENAHLYFTSSGGEGFEMEGTLTGDPDGLVQIALGGTVATGSGAILDFSGQGLTISNVSFQTPGFLNAGLLTMQGSLHGSTFVNEGTTRLSNNFTTDINSTWVNEAGATVEIAGDYTFGGGGDGRILNRGRIVKTLTAGGSMSSGLLGVDNEPGGEVCAEQGLMHVTLTRDDPEGVYCGNGRIVLSSSTPLGIVSPGLSPGILEFGASQFTQTLQPSTVLAIDVEGPDPGTGYDRLDVGGSVVLDGTLRVRRPSGYYPAVGTEFVVLTVPEHAAFTVTGDFANVILPQGFAYEINAKNVTLVVATVVGIEGESGDEIPESFALSSAFPNPFLSSTAFNLEIPEAGRVEVHVFDALGRRVAVLYEGDLAAGSHTVRFEADGLTSGMYFVRATGGGVMQTRRVILMR